MSTRQLSCAAACLTCNAETLVVTGSESSGMSTTVVMPLAAAAAVAVAKPSQSVPGSLMCTCVSTKPGSMTEVDGTHTAEAGQSAPNAPISEIRPSVIATAA